jgi:hypothetical protein
MQSRLQHLQRRTLPHQKSGLVVLPFANLGGDPEQEYFVDGVTESLTTDLSRIGGSFVIGRNTAFTYKGKHIDLKHGQRYGGNPRAGYLVRNLGSHPSGAQVTSTRTKSDGAPSLCSDMPEFFQPMRKLLHCAALNDGH